MRIGIAAALAAAGGIHAAMIRTHMDGSLASGVFFVAVAAFQLAAAVLILRSQKPLIARAIAIVNIAVVGVWVLSRTSGLPFGLGAQEPVTAHDAVTTLLEVFAALGALRLARGASERARSLGRRWIAATALIAVASSGIAAASPIEHGHQRAATRDAQRSTVHGSTDDHHAGESHPLDGEATSHALVKEHGETGEAHAVRAHGLGGPDKDPGPIPGRTSQSPLDAVTVPVGDLPSAVTTARGAIWVTSRNDGTLVRIDPATNATTSILVGKGPSGVTYGFGWLWVTMFTDDTVVRVDPDRMTVVGSPIPVSSGPTAVTIGQRGVWVTGAGEGTLQRIDPATLKVSRPIGVGYGPTAVDAHDGTVWIANTLDRTVVAVDETTTKVGRPIPVDAGVAAITVAYGHVWVASASAGTVTRIDPTTSRIEGAPIVVDDTTDAGQGPTAVVAGGCGMWVANNHDMTVRRIDPTTLDVGPHRFFSNELGRYPIAVRAVYGEGGVWVTDFQGGTAARLTR